jgi:pimeloyl-ACP methyl ester carboxylesterase
VSDVVLVHGAWHGAWCWEAVVAELQRRDVGVTAVELPFTGFADDVAEAASVIGSAGDDVVVCAHSYGGVVVDEAVAGLQNVRHLVYLAAFVSTGGTSILLSKPPPLLDGIIATGTGAGAPCRFDPDYAAEIFYGDSTPAAVAGITPRLRPMVLEGELIAGPGLHRPSIPSTYVVCTRDQAIAPEAQYVMAEGSQTVIEWPTDHSPFLTKPRDVADLLVAVSGPAGAP